MVRKVCGCSSGTRRKKKKETTGVGGTVLSGSLGTNKKKEVARVFTITVTVPRRVHQRRQDRAYSIRRKGGTRQFRGRKTTHRAAIGVPATSKNGNVQESRALEKN